MSADGVGIAGVNAGAALPRQALGQEGREMGRKEVHRGPPCARATQGFGDVTEHRWRRLEVPVGIGDVRMTEVGAERDDVPADGIAVAVALLKRPKR